MKKKNLLWMAVIVVLIAVLSLAGCGKDPKEDPPDEETPTTQPEQPDQPEQPEQLEGKILILQAYGSSNDAAGVSRSFVELYNVTDEAISLSGVTLYYADGYRKNDADFDESADKSWDKVSLSGSIPANGSYLIMGAQQSDVARYQIPESYGDKFDPYFSLSNRAFKVLIMEGTLDISEIQNPFDTDGEGTKVAKYIDMVGAVNNPTAANYDRILGFETAPARCSASEAVRRKDLTDTDDNSVDFIAARYALTGAGAMTNEELEVRKPRNSKAGKWNPFAAAAAPASPPAATGNKLLILQFGAATDGNISHSFVELFNNSDADVNLNSYSLQYAAGFSADPGNGVPGGNSATDGAWKKIDLTGKTIKANSSFLILGKKGTMASPALSITDGYGDINDAEFVLNNRAVKIALMSNQTLLTVQNPYNTDGKYAKATGYVDMVGAINTADTDFINGYEKNPITDLNKQAGQRRKSLTDSDDNKADFERAVYAGASPAEFEMMRPKNDEYGDWDPFEKPTSVSNGNTLLILQAAAPNSNASNPIAYCFVELYNNGSTAVDLTGYSLQFAEGGNNPDEDGAWIKIDLSGSIPPKNSFLILGKKTSANASPALNIAANYGDINDDTLEFSNNAFKVVLLSNQTLLTSAVQNPFDTGSGSSVAGYVDMLGAINTGNAQYILGYEGMRREGMTRQMGIRRTSLDDTDNNANDFECFSYGSVSAEVITAKRPRNSKTDGAWTPTF